MPTRLQIEAEFTKAYRKVWSEAQVKVDKLIRKRDAALANAKMMERHAKETAPARRAPKAGGKRPTERDA